MSLLVGANLLSLAMLVAVFAPIPFVLSDDSTNWIGVGVILAVAGMHFHYFVRGESISELVAEFEGRTPMSGKRADVIFWTYTFGSPSLFVFLVLSIALWRSP
jgi:hypothetical protein